MFIKKWPSAPLAEFFCLFHKKVYISILIIHDIERIESLHFETDMKRNRTSTKYKTKLLPLLIVAWHVCVILLMIFLLICRIKSSISIQVEMRFYAFHSLSFWVIVVGKQVKNAETSLAEASLNIHFHWMPKYAQNNSVTWK